MSVGLETLRCIPMEILAVSKQTFKKPIWGKSAKLDFGENETTFGHQIYLNMWMNGSFGFRWNSVESEARKGKTKKAKVCTKLKLVVDVRLTEASECTFLFDLIRLNFQVWDG